MPNLVSPRGHGFGYVRNQQRPQRPPIRLPQVAAPLPAYVDQRHTYLPVIDQGSFGTCVACGVVAQFEHELIRQRVPVSHPKSRLYVYYWSGVLEGNTGDVGRDPHDGIAAASRWGIPDESYWPYDPPRLIGVQPNLSAVWAGEHRRILEAYDVPQTVQDVLAALAHGYAVGIAQAVYSSYEGQQAATTGVVPMPQAGETLLGYHYNVLCGYATQAVGNVPANHLICRQSWGAGFGDQGYIYLPFEWIAANGPDGTRITEELIAVELVTGPPPMPQVPPPNVPYGVTTSGGAYGYTGVYWHPMPEAPDAMQPAKE